MRKSQVELLVLDVHGVVLSNPLMRFLGQLAEATGQLPTDVINRWQDQLRMQTWTGRITDDELWRCLAGEAQERDWRKLLEEQYELGPAANHLHDWSQRVPIWLLSNHRTAWLLPRLSRFGLMDYFQRTIISDMLGVTKPDPAAYTQILDNVSEPAMALFVDDKSCNVAAAACLGISTVLAGKSNLWISKVYRTLGISSITACD